MYSGVASGRAGRAQHDQKFRDKKNDFDFPPSLLFEIIFLKRSCLRKNILLFGRAKI